VQRNWLQTKRWLIHGILYAIYFLGVIEASTRLLFSIRPVFRSVIGRDDASSRADGPQRVCRRDRYKTLDLHATCHNWNEYGTDRGGTLEQYIQKERIGPCRDPFETFVIDYTGAVMPCCALRSDLPQGIKFAVGNLSEPGTTIFDIYAGQLSAWRRSLVTFGSKTSPCTLAPIVTYLKNSLLPLRRGWKNICSTLAGISTSVHATENSLTGLL